MKTVAFFSSVGGVGRTTLLYHVAHMLAEMGERVLIADLDPQANVTSMFLSQERMEELWPDGEHFRTIYGVVHSFVRGIGDIAEVHVEPLDDNLGLIVGDLALSIFEDKLSDAWSRRHNQDAPAFRAMTPFYRAILLGANEFKAEWVLLDVGPNLGAINRAALIASEHVVVPLGPDLFSLQGLRNLGPKLKEWRESWEELRAKSPSDDITLPSGRIEPLGYVVLQHGIRDNRPPKAYQRWIDKFPQAFRQSVLSETSGETIEASDDPYCLSTIKQYRSLMPMAIQARKPLFSLKPADGAIGAHGQAVRNAHDDFEHLVKQIQDRIDRHSEKSRRVHRRDETVGSSDEN